jgi:putative membrane protein
VADHLAGGVYRKFINDSDRARINSAIRTTGRQTDGEIFCVIAEHSSDYHHHPIIWAAAVALIVPLSLILLTDWPAPAAYLFQITIFLLSALALSHPGLRFHIIPGPAKRARAHATAIQLFSAQGLHKTEHRTGVLIFASTAERYVEVIADAVINEKVTKDVWHDAVSALAAAIKAGRAADGFVTAIEKCGDVLAAHFPPGALKRDDLSSELIEI